MDRENIFSPEFKKGNFADKKAKVTDYLKREAEGNVASGYHENEGKLDENIRVIITKLNQLPFLYTKQACGGHLITEESMRAKYPVDKKFLQVPPKGMALYRSGEVLFETDRSVESKIFIKRLQELVDKSKGASLFYPDSEAGQRGQKLPYILEFGESHTRHRGIDIENAKELETRREEFKKNFEKLIDQFLQSKE